MKKPDLMTDAEIEALLPKLDGLIEYAEAVKEYALHKAVEQGVHWNGYMLGEMTTKRKFSDEAAVGRILSEAGFDPYAKPKLQSITDLQKLVGKARFEELVGGFVTRPKGQPILIKEK